MLIRIIRGFKNPYSASKPPTLTPFDAVRQATSSYRPCTIRWFAEYFPPRRLANKHSKGSAMWRNTLGNARFQEKFAVLLCTAVLTGVLVPLVKNHMDRTLFEQQTLFEVNLAQQAELVQARTQFLKELVDPLWQFQLLALQVSYDANDKDKLAAAIEKYDEGSWEHLKRIRALVGGSRWFTSEATQQRLTEFIDKWLLVDIDHRLMILARQGVDADWREFNQRLYIESRQKTDALLVALAEDFGLSPESATTIRK